MIATYIVTSTRPSDRLRRDRRQKKRKEFKLTVSILAEKSRNQNGISIKKTHLQKRLGATTLGGETGIDNKDGAHIRTLCPTNPSQIEFESPARPNVSNRYNSKALGYGFTFCSWPSPRRVASGIVCPRPWSWPSSFSFCGPGWVFHSGRQAFGTLVWRRWNLVLGERDRSDSSVVVVQSVSIVSTRSGPSHDCWFCSCPGRFRPRKHRRIMLWWARIWIFLLAWDDCPKRQNSGSNTVARNVRLTRKEPNWLLFYKGKFKKEPRLRDVRGR